MKINLQDGHIDAYNFKLTSGSFTLSNEHLSPSDGNMRKWYGSDGTSSSPNNKGNIIFKAEYTDPYTDSKCGFAITSRGHFYAEAGKIANWNIGTNSLITDAGLGETNSFHMYADGQGSGTIGT
jgi:hypothetical protein